MIIYGVAILAFCFVVGQIAGAFLGKAIGVSANVGGVGFAMVLLMLLTDRLQKKGWLDLNTENGIQFWNQLYIPIVVAMSAIQNVKAAVTGGPLALLAGIVPVVLCVSVLPLLSRLSADSTRK